MKRPGPVESQIAPPCPLKLSNYSFFSPIGTQLLWLLKQWFHRICSQKGWNPGPNSWANSWLAKAQDTPANTVTADLGMAGSWGRKYQVAQGDLPSASPAPESLPSLVPHRSSERYPKVYLSYFKLLLKFLGAFMAPTGLHWLSLWEAKNLMDLFLQ